MSTGPAKNKGKSTEAEASRVKLRETIRGFPQYLREKPKRRCLIPLASAFGASFLFNELFLQNFLTLPIRLRALSFISGVLVLAPVIAFFLYLVFKEDEAEQREKEEEPNSIKFGELTRRFRSKSETRDNKMVIKKTIEILIHSKEAGTKIPEHRAKIYELFYLFHAVDLHEKSERRGEELLMSKTSEKLDSTKKNGYPYSFPSLYISFPDGEPTNKEINDIFDEIEEDFGTKPELKYSTKDRNPAKSKQTKGLNKGLKRKKP